MVIPNADRIEQISLATTKLWQAELNSIQYLSDSANLVFTFTISGKRLFLRFTSPLDRTLAQVEAELDFVRYLHRSGVRVSLPLGSVNGREVEIIQIGNEPLLASAFQEAEGEQFVFGARDLNEKEFRLRGQTLGRIHALAKNYLPPEGVSRFQWNEDDLLRHTGRYLPGSERIVWTEYDQLMNWLCSYPKGRDSFGLIHGDFGPTNYRCKDGELTLFDFDDCCYHWFAYDIAITIYPHGWRSEADTLLASVLAGYAERIDCDLPTRADLTAFCRLRQLYMFLSYAKRWGFTNLSEQQKNWFSQKRLNIARGYALGPT
jgi:amicoumacin kinase